MYGVIEIEGKHDENGHGESEKDGGGEGRGEWIVPELKPREKHDFEQEQKHSHHGGEHPGDVDEPTHAVVRWLFNEGTRVQALDRVDVG